MGFVFEDDSPQQVAGGVPPAPDPTSNYVFEDDGQPPVMAQSPLPGPRYELEDEPPTTPWYAAKVDLPSWVDQDKWNAGVTAFETNVQDNLVGPLAKAGKAAITNPLSIAEAVTDIAQKTPGFVAGLLRSAAQVAAELIHGSDEETWEDVYKAAGEAFQQTSKGVDEALKVYEPGSSEDAEAIANAVFLPATAFTRSVHQLADSDALKDLVPEDQQGNASGVLKFIGDIGGLLLQGKVMKAAEGAGKGKGATPATPATEVPLDTTFAKDQIVTRMAKEKASTPQRPLDTLARKEETLAAERPYAEKQAELEQTFASKPETAFQPPEYGGKLNDLRQQIRIEEQTKADMAKFGRGQRFVFEDEPTPITPKEGITNAESVTQKAETGSREQAVAAGEEGRLRVRDDSQSGKGQEAQGQEVEVGRWVEPTMPLPTTPPAPPTPGHRATVAGPGGEIGYAERRTRGADLGTERRAAVQPTEPPSRAAVEVPPNSIPELRNTEEALAFGETAGPEQIARLQTMLEDSRAKSTALMEQAKAAPTVEERLQLMTTLGIEKETFKGQLFREALEAAKGESPRQQRLRSLPDIARDINTALGKKGSVGKDLGGLSPEQLQAYDRLAKDYLVIRRNAKRVSKSVEDYLTSIKVDPRVAAAINTNGELLLARASAVYGANILKRYEDAADQPLREGKYAGSVNVTKQEAVSQAGLQLERAVAANAPAKRPISDAEVAAMSGKTLANPKSVDAAFQRAEKLSGGKLSSMAETVRTVNADLFNTFGDIIDQYKRGDITQEQYNAAMVRFNENTFRVTSDFSSELGRALRTLRNQADPGRIMEQFAKLKKPNARQQDMIQKAMAKWRDGTLTPDDIKLFEKYLPDPRWSDYLKQIWYNNVLSGPVTHMKNTISNASWSALQVPFRAGAGSLSAISGLFGNKSRTRYVNEVLPMMAGYGRGWTRGRLAAKDMFTKGRVDVLETKWAEEMGTASSAFERSPHAALRRVAPAFTLFTRSLQAMDVWANAIAYDGHIAALARRAANSRKLKGVERTKFETDYIANPPESVIPRAQRQARYTTFMNHPDPFTSGIITLRNIPVIGTAFRFTVAPFVNTIGNLMKRGMEFTPGLGIAKELASYGMREGIRRMPEGRTKALGKEWSDNREYNIPDIAAKQVAGVMLSAYILYKASQGRITGPLPDDPAEREFWYRNNITPWSIRFGGADSPNGIREVTDGTWFSYRWAEPFNTPIAAAAQFYDKILAAPDDTTRTDMFMNFADAMRQNVLDGAYFAGLQNILDKHSNKQKLLPQFAAGWMPYSGFFRTVARTYEVATEGAAKPREANPWMETFASVIPGLAGELPAKLDVYGQESVKPGNLPQQWLPIKWAKQDTDPVEAALASVGFYPSLPNKTIRHQDATYQIPDDIYRSYAIDYGAQLKPVFERVIINSAWNTLSQAQKFDRLQTVLSRIQTSARRRLTSEMYRQGAFTAENRIKGGGSGRP